MCPITRDFWITLYVVYERKDIIQIEIYTYTSFFLLLHSSILFYWYYIISFLSISRVEISSKGVSCLQSWFFSWTLYRGWVFLSKLCYNITGKYLFLREFPGNILLIVMVSKFSIILRFSTEFNKWFITICCNAFYTLWFWWSLKSQTNFHTII